MIIACQTANNTSTTAQQIV